jgi:hypothetical protein
MKTTLTKTEYQRLREEIAREITRGRQSLEAAYRRQVLVTNWNVGRILRERYGFSDSPSARNARIIARLSADFKRSDAFFYAIIKFHRLYPVLPSDGLSWSHYQELLRIDDPRERERARTRALKEDLNSKELRALYRPIVRELTAPSESGRLDAAPGRLYHYRVRGVPRAARLCTEVRVDIGFKIERQIILTRPARLCCGRIVRVLKDKKGRYSVRLAACEPARLYTYEAVVTRVVDGDTIIASIDLGFRTWIEARLRLRGINCPEVTTDPGKAARFFVKKQLPKGAPITVKTYKDDKYGRYLADVHFRSVGTAEPTTFLNQLLLDKGLARVYRG